MKLSISVEGDPAAIEGVICRILEHLHGGEAVSFRSAIQPESAMGVEGWVEVQATQPELAAWKQALALVDQGRSLRLQDQSLIDWLKTQVKAMDIPDEQKLPIFAQLYTTLGS